MTTRTIIPVAPKTHQRKGVEIARKKPAFLFAWKPGTGKTFLMLFIMEERPMRTVIVAQKSIIPTAWEKDAKAIGQPIRVINAKLSKAKRSNAIASCPPGTALVMNQEMFRTHEPDLIEWGVRRLILDESSRFKNRETRTWKAALRVSALCEERYLLSGTPAPNCPTELWAQLRILSNRAVGRTFFSWAHQWFIPVKVNIGRGRMKIKEWILKPEKEAAFYASLRPWVWFLSKKECVDLPETTDAVRMFWLSDEEERIYDEVHDEFFASIYEHEDDILVRAEGRDMKLRQITSGFIIDQSQSARVFGSSRLDELFELLEELGPRTPIVIWAEFRATIERLIVELNRNGRAAVAVYGGSKTSAEDAVSRLVSGEIDTIIAHPRSMGHGTDGIQAVCTDAIYFELSYSGEEHEQSRDRIHRTGQTGSCTFHYLIAEGTIDEALFDAAKGKITRQEALLREFRRSSNASRAGVLSDAQRRESPEPPS